MVFRNIWVERREKFILIPTDGVITEDIAQAKEKEGYTLYHVDQTDAELTERLHENLGDWMKMFEGLQSEGLVAGFS